MSKTWILLTGALFLGSAGALQAHPLDAPDIVYLDGLPCNSACQDYLAWSRQKLSMSGQAAPDGPAKRSTDAVRPATETRSERSKLSAPTRITRRAVPIPREMPRPAIAASQPAIAASHPAIAASEPAEKNAPSSDAKPAKTADLPAAASDTANSGTPTTEQQVATAASQPAEKPAPSSDATQAKIANLPAAAGATANSGTSSTRQEVAAALAASATATAAPEQKSNNIDLAERSETVQSSDVGKTASASQTNTGGLVAIVMARPEINSVSDLTNKDIAIDDKTSASSVSVRAAMAAAGASQAQLIEGHAEAVDRVVSGEVPAAVLALVSPEAAGWFPEIEGFKIFRIPLSPGSVKAPL